MKDPSLPIDLKATEVPDKKLLQNCLCACGLSGTIDDCTQETEQESWEMPEYIIDLCPKCCEVIEDYFWGV